MESSPTHERNEDAHAGSPSALRWLSVALFMVVAGVSYRHSPPFLVLALVSLVRLPVRFSPAVLVAGLVAAFATLSLTWSIDLGKSWLAVQNAGACLGTFLLFYWGIKTRTDLKRALTTLAFAGVVVVVLFLAFAEPPVPLPYYGYVESGELRPTLPGVNVNYLAYVMVTSVAAAAALLRLFGSELRFRFRAATIVGILVCAIGIWQTGTRGAAVSALAVMAAAVLTRFWPQLTRLVMGALVVASAAWSLFGLVLDPKWIRTVEAFFPRQSGDLGARLPLWEAAGALLQERPSLGLGVSAYTLMLDGVYAHNAYLSIALGMGLVGLALFTILILVSTFSLGTSRNGRDPRPASVAAIFLAAFVPIWLTGVWEWSLWAWAGLGICAAANAVWGSASERRAAADAGGLHEISRASASHPL